MTAQVQSLAELDPAAYVRHGLHSHDRTYAETNCYTDVLIELLHATGYEPLAMLGHIVRMDFEGDQWTFFKPPTSDLERLYGIDIHEMQQYRPLEEQITQQLGFGRTVMVDLDAFYLPDTVGISYRAEHTNTTVVPAAIDPRSQALTYFHGPGLFRLDGEDYRRILRVETPAEGVLPPLTELVRFDAGRRLQGEELRETALILLRHHLIHRPDDNPVDRFAEALARDLPVLRDGDITRYHAYAFATVRIAGSGFDALRSHVKWLFGAAGQDTALRLTEFVEACKALSFRLARRREFDPQELLAMMASGWSRALEELLELSA